MKINRSREAQILSFLRKSQATDDEGESKISRITLAQLADGVGDGGARLETWSVADSLRGSDEDVGALVEAIITRCHEETDAATTVCCFQLMAYPPTGDRSEFRSVRLRFMPEQLGDGEHSGATSGSGIMRILTSHIEKKDALLTEMCRSALMQNAQTQSRMADFMARHEEAHLAAMTLKEDLLDRKMERDEERVDREEQREVVSGAIEAIVPLLPAALKHVVEKKGKKKVAKLGGSVKAEFSAWVVANGDSVAELTVGVGEEQMARLLEFAELENRELESAVKGWLLDNDLGRSKLVEVLGAEKAVELGRILNGDGK